MDFHSINKAIINRNIIETKLPYKTIVFVVSRVREGVVAIEQRFPHQGEIEEVYVTCTEEGITDTAIQIERVNEYGFNNGGQWKEVLQDNLILEGGKKSSKDSPYQVSNKTVNENDHFRVRFDEVGEDIGAVTVEIKIRLSTKI